MRKGTSKNIVIDFVGGGGCWDEFTCGFADATFTDNVDWIDDIVGVPVEGNGIYDINNENNPFKDDHHNHDSLLYWRRSLGQFNNGLW